MSCCGLDSDKCVIIFYEYCRLDLLKILVTKTENKEFDFLYVFGVTSIQFALYVIYFFFAERRCPFDDLPIVDNIERVIKPNNSFGDIAIYLCKDGYKFHGNSTYSKVTCLADGQWESLPHHCESKLFVLV